MILWHKVGVTKLKYIVLKPDYAIIRSGFHIWLEQASSSSQQQSSCSYTIFTKKLATSTKILQKKKPAVGVPKPQGLKAHLSLKALGH